MSITEIFRATMAGLILFATAANAQTADGNAADAALVDRVKDAVVKELRESGAIDRAVDAGIALSLHGAIDRLPACSNRECPTAMNKPSLLHSRVCRVGRRCDNDRHGGGHHDRTTFSVLQLTAPGLPRAGENRIASIETLRLFITAN